MPLIPIALWFSLCTTLGGLLIRFPSIFSSAGNYAVGAGMWARATINNTKRLGQLIVAYGTAALIIWFLLLSFTIYTSRWEWAVVGLLSAGLCFVVASLFFLTTRSILTPTLLHVQARATAWSAAIPLRTLPWNSLPFYLKVVSLLLSPFYGFYAIFALPTKGVLEMIAVVAAFGPTLNDWLKLLQRISAAVTVVVSVLAIVTMFQLQWGYHILDLVSLGLGFLFVGLLIALLLMRGQALIDVWDFITGFGFVGGLFLIGLMWFHHALPVLATSLQANLQAHYDKLLTNVIAYDFVAVLVTLVFLGAICFMPWLRGYALVIAMPLLFLYTFGIDPTTQFYLKWQWWVGFVGIVIGLLFLRTMKRPQPVTAHPHPVLPGAPATPAPAAPAAAGHGGHGSHSNVSFWHVFAVAAVVAAVVLAIMFYNKIGQTQASNLPPAPAPVVVVQQPVPAPRQTVTNLMDFAVLKDGTVDGVWDLQLDARQTWKTQFGLAVSHGDQVEFSASGLVCGGPNIGCSGPNGQDNLAKTSFTNPGEFPFGDARCQALVGRIGSNMFQVGDQKTYVVPEGTGSQSIELMDNYRMPYVETTASGGFRVKIIIRKKA